MDFLIRIASLVRKELLAVLRDKKSRLALIIPPIIQIAIFGYAAHHERHPRAIRRAGQRRRRSGRPVHRGPGRHGNLPAPGRRGHGKRH